MWEAEVLTGVTHPPSLPSTPPAPLALVWWTARKGRGGGERKQAINLIRSNAGLVAYDKQNGPSKSFVMAAWLITLSATAYWRIPPDSFGA